LSVPSPSPTTPSSVVIRRVTKLRSGLVTTTSADSIRTQFTVPAHASVQRNKALGRHTDDGRGATRRPGGSRSSAGPTTPTARSTSSSTAAGASWSTQVDARLATYRRAGFADVAADLQAEWNAPQPRPYAWLKDAGIRR
jgi:hypothetical protein